MRSNYEMRAAARTQLGSGIFQKNWLMAVVVVLLGGAIISASAVVAVGPLLLGGPISAGMLAIFLKLKRTGGEINVGDMFSEGFNEHFTQYFLTYLLTSLYTFLWGLLLIVPGIVKSYSYAMAQYVAMHNKDLSASDCIRYSQDIMDGHKWDLFLLDLSFIGWYILGSLCLGVGTLWVTAYLQTARANFFDDLYADFMQARTV